MNGTITSVVGQATLADQVDTIHSTIIDGAITSAVGQATLAAQVDTVHTILTSGAVASVSVQISLPVCPSPSDFFTGRVALLKMLETLFDHPGRRVVTIIGKGGCGKTQLTLKFVNEYRYR